MILLLMRLHCAKSCSPCGSPLLSTNGHSWRAPRPNGARKASTPASSGHGKTGTSLVLERRQIRAKDEGPTARAEPALSIAKGYPRHSERDARATSDRLALTLMSRTRNSMVRVGAIRNSPLHSGRIAGHSEVGPHLRGLLLPCRQGFTDGRRAWRAHRWPERLLGS